MPEKLPTREIVVSLNPDMPLGNIATKAALEGAIVLSERGRGDPSESIPGMFKRLQSHGVAQAVSGAREGVVVLMESRQWDTLTELPKNHVFRLFWTLLEGIRRGVKVDEQSWVPVDQDGKNFHDPEFSEEALRGLQEEAICWFRDLVLGLVSRKYGLKWIDRQE